MDTERANRLANSFARAKELTNVVSTPEFNKYAKELVEGGYVDSNNDFVTESTPSRSSYDARREMDSMKYRKDVDYSKSKLPKKILDEIRENPLDGLSSDPTMDEFARKLSEKIVKEKPSFSDYTRNENNHKESLGNGNDYEIIKMIVEGIVKKYVEPLNKKMINENSDKKPLNTLYIGKNFKFIDGSGNIFEAVLKYVGNVNSIKK